MHTRHSFPGGLAKGTGRKKRLPVALLFPDAAIFFINTVVNNLLLIVRFMLAHT